LWRFVQGFTWEWKKQRGRRHSRMHKPVISVSAISPERRKCTAGQSSPLSSVCIHLKALGHTLHRLPGPDGPNPRPKYMDTEPGDSPPGPDKLTNGPICMKLPYLFFQPRLVLLQLRSSKMRCRSTSKPVYNNCRYNKGTAYKEQTSTSHQTKY
jgi:hypothetical protein